MRRVLLLLSAALFAGGCAQNYYDRYRQAHPEWEAMAPARGASLEETVASIYAPPVASYRRLVQAVMLLQRDGSSWQEIPLDSLVRGAFVPQADGTYAVIASVFCNSTDGRDRWMGNRVSWYLLPSNRLAAEDHYEYTEHCITINTYEPATGDLVPLEHELADRSGGAITAAEPNSHFYYQKGLKLVSVGRIDEAGAMLDAGDHGFDPSGARPNFEAGRAVRNIADATRVAALRDDLERELEKAGANESPPPNPPPR